MSGLALSVRSRRSEKGAGASGCAMSCPKSVPNPRAGASAVPARRRRARVSRRQAGDSPAGVAAATALAHWQDHFAHWQDHFSTRTALQPRGAAHLSPTAGRRSGAQAPTTPSAARTTLQPRRPAAPPRLSAGRGRVRRRGGGGAGPCLGVPLVARGAAPVLDLGCRETLDPPAAPAAAQRGAVWARGAAARLRGVKGRDVSS